MTEEASKLDQGIDHLKQRVDKLKRIKSLAEDLEKTGKVDIIAPKNSHQITIITTQEAATEAMQKLADITAMGSNRIEYIHERDEYRLETKYMLDK